jgi:hypothetical protein
MKESQGTDSEWKEDPGGQLMGPKEVSFRVVFSDFVSFLW